MLLKLKINRIKKFNTEMIINKWICKKIKIFNLECKWDLQQTPQGLLRLLLKMRLETRAYLARQVQWHRQFAGSTDFLC